MTTTERAYVSTLRVGDKIKVNDGLWHRVLSKTGTKKQIVLTIADVGNFVLLPDDVIEVHRCL